MWHVSNEYACHNLPCYCDTCAVAFRALAASSRYATLDALNDAWGTAFWSQRYTAWDDILPPRRTTTFTNPTHVLDYHRFGSDTLLDFYRAEHEVIRRHSPDVPVTTNFMTLSHFRLLDYHDWAPFQDVVSTDHYVVDALADPQAELSFSGDLTRGLAGGRPWMLMEHSTSAVNWQPVNPAKAPGGTITRLARPRRPRRRHPRLLPVAPVPRGLGEVPLGPGAARRRGQRPVPRGLRARAPSRDRLGELVGSRVEAEVAVLWDYESAWAVAGPCMPSSAIDYATAAHTVHRLLRDRGRHLRRRAPRRRPVRPTGVVVVPTLYLVSDAQADAVARGRRGAAPTCWSPTSPASATPTTTCGSAATRARSATCSASGSRSSSPCGSRSRSPCPTAVRGRSGARTPASSTPRS